MKIYYGELVTNWSSTFHPLHAPWRRSLWVTSTAWCVSIADESLALPTGAVVNCADNSGAKNLYIIGVFGTRAAMNRLPMASAGDMVVSSVKKGKPELRKKIIPSVVVRQRKPWRRHDGIFLYFEDNAGVIVNPKGEMKGSAITGPVAKECVRNQLTRPTSGPVLRRTPARWSKPQKLHCSEGPVPQCSIPAMPPSIGTNGPVRISYLCSER